MVAVADADGVGLERQRGRHTVVPAARRRFVAVAVSPMELLRPESDLARIVGEAGRADLLIARDDRVDLPGPAGPVDEPDDDDDEPDDELDELTEELAAAVGALDLQDLRVHRLGLPGRLGGTAEADLVAALSELVGFDPEAGVYCVAPVPDPADPERMVVVSAAHRIARTYGLPLLRYRCLALTVVPPKNMHA